MQKVTVSQCKVLGVSGRAFHPTRNRPLSRSTRGTHFQVVSKQQETLTKRNPLTTHRLARIEQKWNIQLITAYVSVVCYLKVVANIPSLLTV